MLRALLPLTCLALLTPQRALADETCPSFEPAAGPPVYALLFGYPHDGPVADSWPSLGTLPDLPMVDDDLYRMARFFQALGPQRMRIHGEPDRAASARLSSFGVRPPTWPSLLESVAELVADLDAAPAASEPQVYVYLAGHGRQARMGDRTRLLVFGRPTGEAPGYDGFIDSGLFAEHVLTPLASRARVHLIADVCFAYTLLQTREMKRSRKVVRSPTVPDYITPFRGAFPDVGAQLASYTVTFEEATIAGLFSHVLRSAAIGPADVDRDGVITYGEMTRALTLTARANPHLEEPIVLAPDADPSAPFLRWRQSPAARVCTPPGKARRLHDGPDLFATLPASSRPTLLWLSPEHPFSVGHVRFEATDGMRLPLAK